MVLKEERTGIEKKFFEVCAPLCEELGYEIYDLDYIKGSYTLRIFILNPETGTALIEDCSNVDRSMTPIVEEAEWMPKELVLEVSSPGMFRHLNTVDHFLMSLDKEIQISLKKRLTIENYPTLPKALKGERKFVGKLNRATETAITITAFDFELEINYEDIKKANLEPALNLEE
jgi:ribosome maturation factor RimP